VLGQVVGLHILTEVWKALLKELVHDSQERKFTLTQRLHYYSKGMKSITMFLHELKQICDGQTHIAV